MKRPILDYQSKPRRESRADSGGVTMDDKRDVRKYQDPWGPTNVDDRPSPGLHGDNYGNSGTQGKQGAGIQKSGSPGLGGDASRKSGSQGRR